MTEVHSILLTLPDSSKFFAIQVMLFRILDEYPGNVPFEAYTSRGEILHKQNVRFCLELMADVKGLIHPDHIRVVRRGAA